MDGAWYWSDGVPANYIKWSPGEPNQNYNIGVAAVMNAGVKTVFDKEISLPKTFGIICQKNRAEKIKSKI